LLYVTNGLPLAIYFFFLPAICFTQIPEKQEEPDIIESIIESIAESAEDNEFDFITLSEDLTYFYQNPINLNTASKEQLEQLPLLNEIQINNLLEHIDNNGKLMSIYELQAIDGFDLDVISNVIPFVKVSKDIDTPDLRFKQMLKTGKHEILIRYQQVLEDQKGFLDS